jgi:membrane protease YdiL (CAAX protease family)
MTGPAFRASPAVEWAILGAGLVLPLCVTWVFFVLLANAQPFVQQAAYAVGKTIQLGLPLAWAFTVRRGELTWKRPGLAGLPAGLSFGLIVFVAMLILYYAWLKPSGYLDHSAEPIRQKLAGFRLVGLWSFAVFGAFVSIGHAFLEEYYWRWFMFGGLAKRVPWRWAAVISSAGFVLNHLLVLADYFGWWSPPMVLFSIAVAFGGLFWAWLYHRSRSLVGPWIGHLLIDAGIFVVGFDLVHGSLSG